MNAEGYSFLDNMRGVRKFTCRHVDRTFHQKIISDKSKMEKKKRNGSELSHFENENEFLEKEWKKNKDKFFEKDSEPIKKRECYIC